MFTVRDAENAMITFTILAIGIIIAVVSYALIQKGQSFVSSLSVLVKNVPHILSTATLLTLLEEGISLMFYRIRESFREEERIRNEARKELRDEIVEWDQRRKDAEARGEKFTEPMPGHDLPKKKKRRFLFF